jgi:hypothetical protein
MKTKITILLLFICSVGIGQDTIKHVIKIGKQDTVYYDPAHPNFVRKANVVYIGESTLTWPELMLESFISINSPYITYTQAEKDTILGRLSQSYIVNTFGPSGQKKTVCDFFMIFWNSNTTTALATRANTNSGATLRWNYGAGNIYTQNDLPGQVNTGVISVSSTDGFSSLSLLNMRGNSFIRNFPIGSLPGSITYLSIYTNSFIGDWALKTLNNSFTSFNIFANKFSGSPPKISSHITNGLIYAVYSCEFNSASNLTEFRKAMTEFRLDGNALQTAKVDELLHNLNLYYTANAPTADCTINLSGATMGIPTGGASNSDIIALQNIWTAAGKTLTITVRTS